MNWFLLYLTHTCVLEYFTFPNTLNFLSTVALIVTVASQVYTQRMQMKITKMESARFKSEIPITFESSNLNDDGTPSNSTMNSFDLTNDSSETVYDVRFKTVKGYWHIQQPVNGRRDEMKEKDIQRVALATKPYPIKPNVENTLTKCTIEITYQDIRGVRYKHSVGFNSEAKGYEARRPIYIWDKKIERLSDED